MTETTSTKNFASRTQSDSLDHLSGKNPLPKIEEVSKFEDDILELEEIYFDDEDFRQNDERKSSFEFYGFDDLKLLIADFSDKFWK